MAPHNTRSPTLIGAMAGAQGFILTQFLSNEEVTVTTEIAIMLIHCALSANLLCLIIAQYCGAALARPDLQYQTTAQVKKDFPETEKDGAKWPTNLKVVWYLYASVTCLMYLGEDSLPKRPPAQAFVAVTRVLDIVHFARRQLFFIRVLNPQPMVPHASVPGGRQPLLLRCDGMFAAGPADARHFEVGNHLRVDIPRLPSDLGPTVSQVGMPLVRGLRDTSYF